MKSSQAITSLFTAAWACALLSNSGCSEPTAAQTTPANAPVPARAPESALDRVTVGHPQRKTLMLHTAQPGRIQAFEETPLFSKVNGYVDEVLVDIGDRVAKDQTLVKLWIPELQDDLDQKEALVTQAEAEVKQAEAAVHAANAAVETARARISQAEAGTGRAQADFQYWQDQYARIKELAGGGSVTQKLAEETFNQFRSAESARKESAAHVESAQAALREAEAKVRSAQADEVAAAARLRVAQANRAKSKTMLAYGEIKAPFDGVITRRSVDTGHYVHPSSGGGTPPLLVVARVDTVRVFVDIPEMEAPLVDSGDRGDAAVVTVQSLANREIDAKVARTSWSLDASNRSLRVELDVPNEGSLLRPGMYAKVTILLDQRDDVLALPVSAISREGGRAYCFTVEDGKLKRKELELGLRSGADVEVRSGVSPKDVVVLARAETLVEGQAVEVITPGD